MESEKDIRDELSRIAPGFPEKERMAPPDGYFKTFPDKILRRWQEERSAPIHRSFIWRKPVAIAAVLAAVLIGGLWFLIKTEQPAANEITAMEAYQYIQENFEDFEEMIEAEEIIMDESTIDIPPEAIEEFLLEELEVTELEEIF